MNLLEIQTQMLEAIMQPLTSGYNMQRRARDGRPMRDVAAGFIKPNERLSSLERLEIYNRQYWYRILDSLEEDFPGLLAIVGRRWFGALSKAYLIECPSQSFTLRDLGSRLEMWLRAHPEHTHPHEELALDMVRLEWAEVEAFDAAEHSVLIPEALLSTDPDPRFALQPYLRLLELHYPVDELLVGIKSAIRDSEAASNAVAAPAKHNRVRKIARQKPQTIFVAVHRQDDSVYFKRLERDAFLFLSALRDGKRLSNAASSAFEGSDTELNEIPGGVRGWFEEWAALGWFAQPGTID